jgi:hypothetical protein
MSRNFFSWTLVIGSALDWLSDYEKNAPKTGGRLR